LWRAKWARRKLGGQAELKVVAGRGRLTDNVYFMAANLTTPFRRYCEGRDGGFFANGDLNASRI